MAAGRITGRFGGPRPILAICDRTRSGTSTLPGVTTLRGRACSPRRSSGQPWTALSSSRTAAGVRARHRNRPRGRPAGQTRRAGDRHRAVASDDRPAADKGRRGDDPGDRRRHGDCRRPGEIHARLPRLQHDLQPAYPGRAGRVLPQCRPAPDPRWPVRRSSSGCRSCSKLPPGQQATVWRCEPGSIGLDTYDILRQLVVSHHFHFDESRQARLFRSPHRYIWPAELDLMAQLAGFELETRHADWTGAEFTAESRSHVSVYRIPTAR